MTTTEKLRTLALELAGEAWDYERRCLADSVGYSFAALSQDPQLLAQARAIAAETCSHPR